VSKIADTVAGLARPAAQALGLELWDVEFVREGNRWVLRVLIDRPGGVSIQNCEDMSRAPDPLLDEADPIAQSYVLQVSSAGLERPLKRPSDFARFMGTRVAVRLYQALDGRKEFEGVLTGHDGKTLTLDGGKTFPADTIALVRTLFDPQTNREND